MPGRQQQRGLFAGESGGQGAAVDALYAHPLPFAQGLADGEFRQGIVEACRQADFETPGLSGDPAGGFQVVGGGGQGVAGRAPDVTLAVAVEVHGILVVGGRDELGLAHGAGPGADHEGGRNVAVLENLQGGEQLGVGEFRAASFIGEGRQGADHVLVAHVRTVVALHAPDRHHRIRIHRIARVDFAEDARMLRQARLALANAQRIEGAFQVLPYRSGEFRLAAVGFDHGGIGLDAGEGAIEGLRIDSTGQRLLTEGVTPLFEALPRLGLVRRASGHRGGRAGAGEGRLGLQGSGRLVVFDCRILLRAGAGEAKPHGDDGAAQQPAHLQQGGSFGVTHCSPQQGPRDGPP